MPYSVVNTAVTTNEPSISSTENQNCAVSVAGIHAPGKNGIVNALVSWNTLSSAAPRTTGGNRLADRATMLPIIPRISQRIRPALYSVKRR